MGKKIFLKSLGVTVMNEYELKNSWKKEEQIINRHGDIDAKENRRKGKIPIIISPA